MLVLIDRGKKMKTTTPKKFRAELKHYLEVAEKEPIKIKRRSGKNYILINDMNFTHLKEELQALKNKLLELGHDFKFEPIAKKEKIVKGTKKVVKKLKKKIKKKATKVSKKKLRS